MKINKIDKFRKCLNVSIKFFKTLRKIKIAHRSQQIKPNIF